MDVDLLLVSKRFGSHAVIEGLSLHGRLGEVAVFLGPSGCGKSTLPRMIAGLEEVNRGEIRLDAQPGPAMTFGIRAEAVRIDPAGQTRGRVEIVERLGDRTLVRLRDGPPLVAEDAGTSRARVGDELPLRLDLGAAHLSDAGGTACHAG